MSAPMLNVDFNSDIALILTLTQMVTFPKEATVAALVNLALKICEMAEIIALSFF